MSDATKKARQILDANAGRPNEHEVSIARVYAHVAQAEALEQIAGTLQNILDRGGLR